MKSESTVEKPVYLRQVARTEQIPERTRYREQWFSRRLSADPVRVFVVDSDVDRSAHLVAQVHAIGSFETRRASSCGSALRMADDYIPNIVLLDIEFPDLASFRLATSLRWHSGLVGVRLIALTSDAAAVDRSRALEAGFEQYLTIPAQHAALERVLKQPLRWVDSPARGPFNCPLH